MRHSEIINRTALFELGVYQTLFNKTGTLYEVVFYLPGSRCNLQCPGCYMHGGPMVSKQMIPTQDVLHFLRSFSVLDNYSNSVVFSGGEIFTTPVSYMQYNIQNALDTVGHVHLKTNGAWIANPTHADAILKMLGGLGVPRGIDASDNQIRNFLGQFTRKYIRYHRQEIIDQMWREFPTRPALDLCVSVDNKIHPVKSAEWFVKIARRVAENKNLTNNLNLKTFSFDQSRDFFVERVMRPLQDQISGVKSAQNGDVLHYRIGNVNAQSFFGAYADVSKSSAPENAATIGVPGVDGVMRLVFYFYPDKTVSFCSDDYKIVGRVPYEHADGTYKTIDELRREMMAAVVDQYRREISR